MTIQIVSSELMNLPILMNWTLLLFLTLFFPIVSASIGTSTCFYILGGITLVFCIISYFLIQETKRLPKQMAIDMYLGKNSEDKKNDNGNQLASLQFST